MLTYAVTYCHKCCAVCNSWL